MIKIKNYTNEDLDYIKNNYQNLTVKQLTEELNKTENSVYNAIRKLGLKKQKHSKWTDEEIIFLKDNYINMTSEELSNYINHSVDAINAMKDRLNLIKNKDWSNDEIQFLKDNFETTLFCDLSNILGRTEGAIRAKCFDLKLFKNNPWTEYEIDFVKNNYMEMKTKDISKILNRTVSSIELKASRLGLKKYPYTCDYHYFDNIDTEEKAYWLGFLIADGWISKNEKSNAGVVGIELQYSDNDHLKKFNKSISGNYKITDRWKSCSLSKDKGKKYHTCVIRIFSLTMYNTLVKLGFSNEKSYDYSMPKLPHDLTRHYIRGYFDGDGTLCYTNKTFKVNFTTASFLLCRDLLSVLHNEDIDIKYRTYINDFGTTMYRPEVDSLNNKLKFLDWIYVDSSVYLDRKYKKYLKIKNCYNTQSLAS